MLQLRYPWLWLLLGWSLVVAVCVGSLMPGRALRMIDMLDLPDKLLHAASYFVLMVWFAGLYKRRLYGIIALTLLALGFGLEVVQGQLGYRQFDVLDMVSNTLGILAGLALSVSLLEGWCQRVERRLIRA